MIECEGYYLLKCNLHTHFVEHLGEHPEIMVDAYHDAGYDCIALTDHFDKIDDLSLEKRAQEYARKKYGDNFLVVVGLELALNDSTFPGAMRHMVGLFLNKHIPKDIFSEDMTLDESLVVALNEIHRQGGIAIVVHDHRCLSHWNGEGEPDWTWDHRMGKEIDGWEVGNGSGYYEKLPDGSNCMLSHPQESVDEGYIVVADSDAHDVEEMKLKNICHTYVFTKEKTISGIKRALMARRSVASCNGILYGKKKYVELIERYLSVYKAADI